MNGYIIEAYNNMGNAYTCRRLLEEGKKRNMDVKMIGVHDVSVRQEGVFSEGKKLASVDFVINRYKWGKGKDSINALAKKSYNPLKPFCTYINKFQQLQDIESDSFLKPRYILSDGYADYELLNEYLGKRMVAKGLEHSMGREIFLIETKEDLLKLQSYGKEKEWLFEEFIATSYGRDVRVYSIRGEVVGCMKRQSESDFRANVALGAGVTAYETTEEIRRIAKDIYEQTKLDFVGIDLLYGKDCFYFCEINVMPGLEGIEKASGVNVAGKMMDMIYGDFCDDKG